MSVTQPVTRMTTKSEPILSEKAQKRLAFGRLTSLHIFKDQPWLLWESGETGCATYNSCSHCSIMLSVSSTHISTYTEATQIWEL